jgi:hypothetical protein
VSSDAPGRCHHAALQRDGRIYVWGGWSGVGAAAHVQAQQAESSVARYDLNTQSWLPPVAVMEDPHPASTQFAAAQIALPSGDSAMLFFGGWTGTHRTNALTLLTVERDDRPSGAAALLRWRKYEGIPSAMGTPGSGFEFNQSGRGSGTATPNASGSPIAYQRGISPMVIPTGNSIDAPPPLSFATAVSHGATYVVFGGNGVDGAINDAYVLDLSSAKWRVVSGAGSVTRRSSHSACLITHTGGVRDATLMVVFGGRGATGGGGDLQMTASATAAAEVRLAATLGGTSAMTALSNAAAGSPGLSMNGLANTLAQYSQPVGSTASGGTLLNDAAVFDMGKQQWLMGVRIDGAAPPARAGHASAGVGNCMVVVGGVNETGALLNDIWVLRCDRPSHWVWLRVASPLDPTMVTLPTKNLLSASTAAPPAAAIAAAAAPASLSGQKSVSLLVADDKSTALPQPGEIFNGRKVLLPPAGREGHVLLSHPLAPALLVVGGRCGPYSLAESGSGSGGASGFGGISASGQSGASAGGGAAGANSTGSMVEDAATSPSRVRDAGPRRKAGTHVNTCGIPLDVNPFAAAAAPAAGAAGATTAAPSAAPRRITKSAAAAAAAAAQAAPAPPQEAPVCVMDVHALDVGMLVDL